MAKISKNFVCLRITTMDDADINLFRFDFDNTMYQFFMNGYGHIYTRYGFRKDGESEKSMTIEGIRDAMRKALEIHKKEATKTPPAWKNVDTKDLVAFKKDPKRPGGCLHCHHAGFYVRREEYTFGKLSKETVWAYPYPQNIGLEMDLEKNSIVKSVTDPAEKAGIQAGDRIVSVDGQRTTTPSDIQWALNAFKSGNLKVVYERDGKEKTATIPLKGYEWRKTDISWRGSWWDSGPNIGLAGTDLDPDAKKKLNVSADDLAFKVDRVYPKGSAAPAGIQEGDIVVSIDGKSDGMGEVEFQMHLRLAHKAGETAAIGIVRGKQRSVIQVKLK